MKESYREDLASNFGLELYADDSNVVGVATTGVGWAKGDAVFLHKELLRCVPFAFPGMGEIDVSARDWFSFGVLIELNLAFSGSLLLWLNLLDRLGA